MDEQDLAALEHRSYRAMDDGLWDILLGLFLLAFPIGDLTDFPFLPPLAGVAAVVNWRALRKSITEPRVGYVRLHPSRLSRLRRAQCITAAALALTILGVLGLQALGQRGMLQVPEPFRPIAGSLMLAIPIAAAAFLFEVRRMYVYAVLIVAAFVPGRPLIGLGAAGIVIIASGLYVLISFIRRYPLRPKEAGAGG
jgi:hypothetical protein